MSFRIQHGQLPSFTNANEKLFVCVCHLLRDGKTWHQRRVVVSKYFD